MPQPNKSEHNRNSEKKVQDAWSLSEHGAGSLEDQRPDEAVKKLPAEKNAVRDRGRAVCLHYSQKIEYKDRGAAGKIQEPLRIDHAGNVLGTAEEERALKIGGGNQVLAHNFPGLVHEAEEGRIKKFVLGDGVWSGRVFWGAQFRPPSIQETRMA